MLFISPALNVPSLMQHLTHRYQLNNAQYQNGNLCISIGVVHRVKTAVTEDRSGGGVSPVNRVRMLDTEIRGEHPAI